MGRLGRRRGGFEKRRRAAPQAGGLRRHQEQGFLLLLPGQLAEDRHREEGGVEQVGERHRHCVRASLRQRRAVPGGRPREDRKVSECAFGVTALRNKRTTTRRRAPVVVFACEWSLLLLYKRAPAKK